MIFISASEQMETKRKVRCKKNCPISIMQLLCSCAEVWGPFVASCFLASEGLRRQYPLHHRIVATVINACDHYFHNFHPWDVFVSSIWRCEILVRHSAVISARDCWGYIAPYFTIYCSRQNEAQFWQMFSWIVITKGVCTVDVVVKSP